MCLKNIESNLKSIAYKKSIPFCYSCNKEAPSGVCKTCHSDDLMRLIPGVGCEYGLCRTLHKPYYLESKIMLSIH